MLGYKILYRTGLAILKLKECEILQLHSMEGLMMNLKELKGKIEDEDGFIKIANGFAFTRSDIKVRKKKYYILLIRNLSETY